MDRFDCDCYLARGNGLNVSRRPPPGFRILMNLQNSHCGRSVPMDRAVCSTKSYDACFLGSVARFVSREKQQSRF